MTTFLVQRLAGLVVALVAASVLVFVAVEVLPGDPARAILGLAAEPSAVAALQRELGLDQPAVVRYLRWAGGLLNGDLGQSWAYRVPVADLLAPRLAVTIPLALLAMLLTVIVGLALGLVAALHRDRWGDVAAMTFAQVGMAVPNFWLGLLLILLFAVNLQWLPAGGFTPWSDGIGRALAALLLPALALAAVQAAILARVCRAALLDVAGDDFVRTGRAKGLSESGVLVRHALRNALVPITALMGLQFSYLIAGAVIIENVFFLPGLGRFVFQAIANRDLVVVESVVLLLAALVIAVTFVADVAAHAIDPRQRDRAARAP
jgi:peptide/nickel transport system permease protein